LAQPQSSAWLKAELAREHPELATAYGRPGLYTFKSRGGALPLDFVPRTVFARHFGFSVGPAGGFADVRRLLDGCPSRLRLHVYARDEGEGCLIASTAQLEETRLGILSASSDQFHDDTTPNAGDLVLDVIVPPSSDPAEPWFIGWHRHVVGRSTRPGAIGRQTPPSHAPSRAWSKLEELLLWSGLRLKAGHRAVEIGCAPGGAVVNLLDRGLQVTGIDPGEMAPHIAEYAKGSSGTFAHLQLPAAGVAREQLPAVVDWLLCDANLAPTVTLRYLAHWSKQLRPKLRGILFTLKLNDERMLRALPKLLSRCGELGFGPARAVQLPSHRQEVAVVCARLR